MVETTAGVVVIAGMGELAGRGLEGLEVKAEELVFLEVGHFVRVRTVTVIGSLAVGLAGGELVDEGVEADLVIVMRVLAGLPLVRFTCSSQVQIICVG